MVKHKDFFLETPVTIGNKPHYVRMESYGHSKPNRVIMGVNPLAEAFNILLFDYVYLYLEPYDKAVDQLTALIERNIAKENFRQAQSQILQLAQIFKKQKLAN